MNALDLPPKMPSPLPPPSPLLSPPSPGSPAHRRRRRVLTDGDWNQRPCNLSSDHRPTAHDISKSAQSALQLLQARSDLQAQQQRHARRQNHLRAEAHARLTAGPVPFPTSSEPKLKQRSSRAQRDSAETFFSTRTLPQAGRGHFTSDPPHLSRNSMDSADTTNSHARPASTHSNRSNRSSRSARTSFHSAHSSLDPAGRAFTDFEAIPEGCQPPNAAHSPTVPQSDSQRRRASSASSSLQPQADLLSSMWDVDPEEANSPLHEREPGPASISAYSKSSFRWEDVVPSPRRSRTRSTISAPVSRQPLTPDERPARPSSARQSSPVRKTTSRSDGLLLSDLTSLRALDVGHRQLSHASSLARTLTRPLSAPLKPMLQFWLAASLSTFALMSLSTVMACSYLLTMYDDAARRTRAIKSTAVKASAKATPVSLPMKSIARLFLYPIRGLFGWSVSLPQSESASRPSSPDNKDFHNREAEDSPRPPGPRPPLGPLLASLMLTLTVAMGAGLFRLVAQYRGRADDASGSDADDGVARDDSETFGHIPRASNDYRPSRPSRSRTTSLHNEG